MEIYVETRKANHTTLIKADKNASNGPKNHPKPGRVPQEILEQTPSFGAKHVRMAKTENLTLADTSVRQLTGLLPVILSTHPCNWRIIVHAGYIDILQKETLL